MAGRAVRTPGVRAQILIGLALVTLIAVLSTGFLVLWAGGASLRTQRESTALALARAAAASAIAAVDGARELDRAALGHVARELTRAGDLAGVSYLDPDGRVMAAEPARDAGDRDPPIATAVLSGTGPAFNYRPRADGVIELLAYAPIAAQGRVLGAARVAIVAPAPTTVVLQRSGWLLVVLAVADALLVLALGYFVLTQAVVRPLQAVERATALVSAGDWDQEITPVGPREVLSLASAFNQMTASLASQREQLIRTEKLASVGQLAAGVAHEIGNPLAAILGFVDILRTDAGASWAMSAPERRDLLDRVKAETQRIHRTIEDLLAYSRPEHEAPQATEPLKILTAAQGLLEPQPRFRGVRVVVDPAEGWPRVMAAPGRLQQIIVNLLINAADAMGAEGTVTVSHAREGDRVRIVFHDTGPGVPAELRRSIFDPFFTTKPPGQGTGLGLAISRSIAESFGGTLELGAEGPGATFVLTLPAA